MEEASKICLDLSERAPKTFQEGLQLIWLVGLVFCTICVPNPTLCFGRMDELLLPFYRKDLSNGMITAEKAGELIEDFYCKNNLILGRGEHQMSNGSEGDTGWDRNFCYDAPQYLILGGTRVDGAKTVNELTYLFIKRIIPGFENPVIVLRYTPDFPSDLWEIFSDKMRLNSSILLYNDLDIIPAMISAGIQEQDAINYVLYGCNWPTIPGKQGDIDLIVWGLPIYLLKALKTNLSAIHSMEDLYKEYEQAFRKE